jgi:hypothetical protein
MQARRLSGTLVKIEQNPGPFFSGDREVVGIRPGQRAFFPAK